MMQSPNFTDPFNEFVYVRSYSRWIEALKRRETWPETIERYIDYMLQRVPVSRKDEFREAASHIRPFEVMPSMRALWAAGKALDSDNLALFNCAFRAINHPKAFAEMLYVLMNGTGFGFSVERQFINQLPRVPEKLDESNVEIVIADSKLGWAEGFYKFLLGLYQGRVHKCNYSKVRPRGARLKTFGGRASGPGPLKQLMEFTLRIFQGARGRQLNSLECHDICCFIANIVVVGGVRRSSSISFSNLSDQRMAHAKDGAFWEHNPQRRLANNSVAYTEKPDCASFLAEWLNLMRSGSGERGIFNRESAIASLKRLGRLDRIPEELWPTISTNPCGEIFLTDSGLCNLSEAVVRSGDSLERLKHKVQQAAILGIIQATFTQFNFIGRQWKINAERERLLGVSLTGLRDHDVLGHKTRQADKWLREMRQVVWDTAREWAAALEINVPAGCCCVKPSGTVSSLCGSASGIHPRHAPHYIRRIRVSSNDPLARMLIEQGFPWCPEVSETHETLTTVVFDFPQKSPETSVFRDEVTAIEQLEYWKMLKTAWCDHNPSATIYVKGNEWVEVGNWVYKNWDVIGGLTFLPNDGGIYQLAPYEAIDEDRYHEMVACTPAIDFSQLSRHEQEDNTTGAKEYACSAVGGCDIA